MSFNEFVRKYMFPVPKTKPIRNVLEILVGDRKHTGTSASSFATSSWSRHLSPLGLKFAMKNIISILLTHLCMHKKIVSWVFYILLRDVTDMEKQVRVKYRLLGPIKTPSENTHISDKTILTQMYRVFLNQTTRCSCLTGFHRSNILRIVNGLWVVL